MNSALLLLLLAGLAAWGWSRAMQQHEHAVRVCRRACESHDLQMLDDTVSLSRVGLARDAAGAPRVVRTYRFEFSVDGVDRHAGSLTVYGGTVDAIHLPGVPPGGGAT